MKYVSSPSLFLQMPEECVLGVLAREETYGDLDTVISEDEGGVGGSELGGGHFGE